MPMKSDELSSSATNTWRTSSMRLRSLMSRTKACQRPSGRMFELTSTGTSVPSFRLRLHSALLTLPGTSSSALTAFSRAASAGGMMSKIVFPISSSRS